MKDLRRSACLTLLSGLLCAASPLRAAEDIVISEVCYNNCPEGHQVVEFTNQGDAAVDITDWYYCSLAGTGFQRYKSFTVDLLGKPTLEPGEYRRLHLNFDGVPTATDIYFPPGTINALEAADEAALYVNNVFASTSSIRAYIKWGGISGGRESVAVSAGIWDGGSVAAVGSGESIIFDTNQTDKSLLANYVMADTPNLGYPDHPMVFINSAGNTNADNLIGVIDVRAAQDAVLGLAPSDLTTPLALVNQRASLDLMIDDVLLLAQKLFEQRTGLTGPLGRLSIAPPADLSMAATDPPVNLTFDVTSASPQISDTSGMFMDFFLIGGDGGNIWMPNSDLVIADQYTGDFDAAGPGLTTLVACMEIHDSEGGAAFDILDGQVDINVTP